MKYVVSEALLNVRHGGIVSALAVFIIALTTVLFSALYVLRNAVSLEVKQFEDNPSAVVFPKEPLDDAALKTLDTSIRDTPGVERTYVVSKDEALVRSQRIFGEESALLLRGFEQDNPLPMSIEVFAIDSHRDAKEVADIVERLRAVENVEHVVFESASLAMMDRVRNVIFLLGALVALISVVVVSFSIMLTIYARRDELSILRLVGATYGFIRFPLLLQGCFEGFFGSALGLFVFYLLWKSVGGQIGMLGFMTPTQIGWIIGGATFVGMVGGMIPLRRKLRLVTQ